MAIAFQAFGDLGTAMAALAERVRTSVVEVRTPRAGRGAGTIWRPDGLVVTNHHVAPGPRAEVALADGRVLAGEVIARDERNDLAAVQVSATGLPAADRGDARSLRVGEFVLAIGHPFGVKGALTIGVVSAVLPEGTPRLARELIQADVLLGPGNSGGPLADARGRVIGINAMVAGGLALAVPSHLVTRLLGIRREGPTLGLAARNVEVRPPLVGEPTRAVVVLGVAVGSPAERAGLILGDVVLALDGQPIVDVDRLQNALHSHPGGAARLTIARGGVRLDLIAQIDVPERLAA